MPDPTQPASALPPFTVSAEYAAKQKVAQPAVQPKAGFLTSEFWLHLAALIVPLIVNALAQSSNPTLVIAAQAAASVYTLARTVAKGQAAKSEPAATKP